MEPVWEVGVPFRAGGRPTREPGPTWYVYIRKNSGIVGGQVTNDARWRFVLIMTKAQSELVSFLNNYLWPGIYSIIVVIVLFSPDRGNVRWYKSVSYILPSHYGSSIIFVYIMVGPGCV